MSKRSKTDILVDASTSLVDAFHNAAYLSYVPDPVAKALYTLFDAAYNENVAAADIIFKRLARIREEIDITDLDPENLDKHPDLDEAEKMRAETFMLIMMMIGLSSALDLKSSLFDDSDDDLDDEFDDEFDDEIEAKVREKTSSFMRALIKDLKETYLEMKKVDAEFANWVFGPNPEKQFEAGIQKHQASDTSSPQPK